jgi:hypothetical protein
MYKPTIYAMLMAALACALFALPAVADSQARIVRLSDVQGGVQIDKNTGLGFENAFLNLPITQGAQLRTRDNGRAEIEFEDGSTLRITPNTTIEFSILNLNDAGKHVSTVNLVQGRAYVNWIGKSGDTFTLAFVQDKDKIQITQPAHFRVNASSGEAEVANFKSQLEVTTPSGETKIEKKKMVGFEADNDQPTAAKNFEEDSFDQWDDQSISYHDQYSKNNSTPYGYGYSDLNYYGSFTSFPGYGLLWQPYFTGTGWNPFMDGAWSWYPGMGYMWASAYPWGWMPYYYGNWVFAPGFGWGWQPGGWNGWQSGLHYVGAAATFRAPVPPSGTVNTVAVGRGGPSATPVVISHNLLTGESAGLGLARGSLDNLRHLNSQVVKSGLVRVQAQPQFAATSMRSVGGGWILSNEPAGPSGAGARTGTAPSGHASSGAVGGHR